MTSHYTLYIANYVLEGLNAMKNMCELHPDNLCLHHGNDRLHLLQLVILNILSINISLAMALETILFYYCSKIKNVTKH